MYWYEPNTYRTMKNIAGTLNETLISKYQIQSRDILNELLKIHGIDWENTDIITNFYKFINHNKLNDVSIDDNSNKNEKNIEGIIQESLLPLKKIIGYDALYRKLQELYRKKEAKRLTGELYDYSLAINDSSNILRPYCYAFNASSLVMEGRKFGQLWSKPCKHVASYISCLCETIHQMSHHLAGAIAIGTFFFDITYILLKKEKYQFDIIYDKNFKKKIINEFQQFIHSVNHLSRNALESPFSNVSIFDRIKIKNIVNDLDFYFKDISGSELIEFIMELQKIYLNFINEGDPTKNGMPYRFPICTINLSINKNKEIQDKEFLNYITEKLDIFRYNIFVSEGNKMASCCRLLNNTELYDLASQSNSFGAGGSISLGSHRVVTINFNRIALESQDYNQYISILDKRIENTAKILKAHKELIKETTDKGLQLFISNGYVNINRMFSTFGILGIYEASLYAKKYFNVHQDEFIEKILKHLNNKVLEISKEYDILGNIEQIPGESMAIRLRDADRLIFGKEYVPYRMYSNQFIPLWENVSIFERLKIDGKYNKLLTGGGIVHATIIENITSQQAKKLIQYAAKCGCEHFALNAIYSLDSKGHAVLGDYEECPICGDKIIEKMTRVVGFFTPVGSWNKTRREWEFPKRHRLKQENFCEKENISNS